MIRAWAVAVLVASAIVAGCASHDDDAPGALALSATEDRAAEPAQHDGFVSWKEHPGTMVWTVDGETFVLDARICNTYDDGTFHFALGEGALGDDGHVTATIERFRNEGRFDLTLALEGVRDDESAVSWYAQDPAPGHAIAEAVAGPRIEGTARFSSRIDDPVTQHPDVSAEAMRWAPGSFGLRCR